MKRRVVITGMGAVSPIGNDLNEIYNNLKNGYCGIDNITNFDTTNRTIKLAGEVKNLNLTDFFSPKDLKRMDKVSAFAIIAAKKALIDSNLDENYIKNNDEITTYIGSGIGGLETLQNETVKGFTKGYDRVSPFFVPMAISNMSAALVAIHLGINGVSNCPVAACASGTSAIGEAFRNIRDGYSTISFAGGSEASVTELGVGGFTALKALTTSTDKNRASIPFDKERSGFVIGEGAAIIVLEELEHALKRNAKIYAEVVGYGSTCDASHITAPNLDGIWAAKAMEKALADSNLNYTDIDHINAHGTSTHLNDICESKAINLTFKEHTNNIIVTSTKSMTGHLLGAAGALETIISALSIKHSFIPPTINHKVDDEDCNINIAKNTAINRDVNCVMNNSLGFGGHNCVLVLKKFN